MYRQTAERAASIGLELVTLPAWYDVDDAASLSRLCRELLEGRRPPHCSRDGYLASFTCNYLRSLMATGDERLTMEPTPEPSAP